ncbi:hypothetical protein JW711_00600 [Candidatus Woesearchaeota archaeon]|nr:hypothetical protein [Candidatus Woesearchaeota archaeon]
MKAETKRRKKIIFLSSDTGGGHRATCDALITAIEKVSPGKYELKRVEFFERGNPFISKCICKFYSWVMSRCNWLWGMIYHLSNTWLVWAAIQPFYGVLRKNIRNMVEEEDPDLIVSIHPMVNQLMRKVLGSMERQIHYGIVTSDPVMLHRGWIEPSAEFIVVSSPQAEERALKLGAPKERVKRLGLPINPIFYEHDLDKERIRKEFGLKKGQYTILFSGGGDGGGKIFPIVEKLLAEKLAIQVVVACGRNDELREKLSKMGVVALPFTKKMHELMCVIDLMVIKAGPGTIEESATKGIPMIITSYLPGQEARNVEYAKSIGRAFYEPDTAGAVKRIKEELQNKAGKTKPIPKSDAPVYRIAKFLISVIEKNPKAAKYK